MSDEPEKNPLSASREEALAWFVRLNSGDATAEQRAAFRRWLAADPQHRAEFEKLAAMWGKFESVPDPRRVSRRRALKTGAVVIGSASLLGLSYRNGLLDRLISDYATGTGEFRTVAFADGSQAELDADTALSVDYSPQRRRIKLLRGRALFTVVADAGRPFRIDALNGITEALGTQFVVHRTDDQVIVTVVEHAVTVTLNDAPGAIDSPARLDAGQEIAYDASGLGSVSLSRNKTETAWRQGKLVFEDQSLKTVVSDLNRYRRGAIVLLGPDLESLRVSGIFDIRHPDGVLDAIERTLPVQVTRITPYLVLIRSA